MIHKRSDGSDTDGKIRDVSWTFKKKQDAVKAGKILRKVKGVKVKIYEDVYE